MTLAYINRKGSYFKYPPYNGIVGEERQKVITLNPTNIDLYSVIVENRKEDTGSPRAVRDELGAGPLSTITIQEMLKGVNDSQGNSYFQDNGVAITTLIYKGVHFKRCPFIKQKRHPTICGGPLYLFVISFALYKGL